jgi:ribose/xylose/arabinose/galactoside ABC-type transport system permease subunit
MALQDRTIAPARGIDSIERLRERAVGSLQVFGIVVIAAVLFLVFSSTAPEFATGANLRNILVQTSVLGVVSIGETIVMLLAGIDLSVGAVVLLSSVVISGMAVNMHVPVALAIIAGLASGAGVGLVNGLLSAVVGIEPILVTLGSLMIASGLGQVLLHNSWIQVTNPTLRAVAQNHVAALPLMVLVMLGLYVVASLVMARTGYGRRIYQLGGSPRAARLIGVPTTRVKILAFVTSGVCAAIGGLLQAGQLGVISQNDGQGMEFTAITAVLIGGLSVASGGVGRMEKTLIGALIVGMIVNYLTIRGVSANYQQAVLGGLVLAAVLLDQALRRRRA